MKKVLLIIGALLFAGNVYAEPYEECKPYVIEEGIEALKNTSYKISYDKYHVDSDGEFVPSYFIFEFINLPEGYGAELDSGERSVYVEDSSNSIDVTGGVYKIRYYNHSCSSVIKTEEIRIPFYKKFCDIDKKCEENVFFDGTYENTASNQEAKPKNKISTRLIIVLVILIAVIALFIVVILKRRRENEKGF